jgi:hypothetical protein
MTDRDFELRLRADLRELADEPAPETLRKSVIAIPDEVPTSLGRRLTPEWRWPAVLRFTPLALAAAAVVAIVLLGVGLFVRPPNVGPQPPPASPSAPAASCAPNPAAPSAAPQEWTGPVRPCSATVNPTELIQDEEGDSARGYVDIERVQVDFPSQTHWRLSLASAPPKAATLDPARTVISYGLTFDTTGDGAADYVVGISNEAPQAGDFRVWVTDLATGETEEQSGPPYGYPIEFSHPDEAGPEDDPTQPGMVFTFLAGSAVGGINSTTMFYAWASVEEDGRVVAWDYAPDDGWLR